MPGQPKISTDTLIPIGAVLTVLGAAFFYGILYQKVENLSSQVSELNVSVKQLSIDVNRLIGQKGSISYGGQ